MKRQTVELQAQRATLEEQRTHIAMLETALTNAQERLARKEKVGKYKDYGKKTSLPGKIFSIFIVLGSKIYIVSSSFNFHNVLIFIVFTIYNSLLAILSQVI